MKTVGFILREAREAKGLTFDQIERATKIRVKFLQAIESDEYRDLPSLAYAKGFVKNYAEYLGVSTPTILAFFRRQTMEAGKTAILPKGVARTLNRTWFQLTPGKFFLVLFVGFIALFLTYLGVQYGKLRNAPVLAIGEPKDQAVFTSRKIELFGMTDPDATITVNGISVLVRGDGKFFDQVTLDQGANTVTVIATSRYGKTTTAKRTVSYQQEDINPR